MLPIIVSALLGGFGPGILATALTSLSAAYLAFPPIGSFYVASSQDSFQLSLPFVERRHRQATSSHNTQALTRRGETRTGAVGMLWCPTHRTPFMSKDRQGRYLLVKYDDGPAPWAGRSTEMIGKNADAIFPFATAKRSPRNRPRKSPAKPGLPSATRLAVAFAKGDVRTCLVTKGALAGFQRQPPSGSLALRADITGAKAIEAEREQHRIGLEAQVISRTQELLNLYDPCPPAAITPSRPDGVFPARQQDRVGIVGLRRGRVFGSSV